MGHAPSYCQIYCAAGAAQSIEDNLGDCDYEWQFSEATNLPQFLQFTPWHITYTQNNYPLGFEVTVDSRYYVSLTLILEN
jgi:hypothetical protein